MTRILFLAGVNCLLLAGAAISIAATPVAAQAETQAASEQVTVTAPYIIRRKVVTPPLSQNRLPVEVVSVDYPVSYADLDLSRTADAATFEKRIGDAAKEACAQLTKKYPPEAFMPTPGNQDCVGTATRQAMNVAKQVIAASSRK
ncbi:MAG: UrcA family protein [Rhizomicrobium sp.]